MKTFVVLSTLALSAFGADITAQLKDMIRSKVNFEDESENLLSTAIRRINCDANEFCPLATVPDVTFDPRGGRAGSNGATACCPGSYVQCQVQENQQFCRDLLYYTIQPGQGNAEEVCPQTTPDCTCQTLLAGEKDLQLKLCPIPGSCCPNCECHGDPHCTSFDKHTKVWAHCDDRDATCVHKASTCALTQYGGKPCVWQNNYCAQDPTLPAPQMIMYQKTYKSYWNSADNQLYEFKMVLTLGAYGSISKIDITDAGTTYTFGFTAAGACRANPTFPLNNGIVHISSLPSDVTITMECKQGQGNPTGMRWDIKKVQDPWFVNPHPVEETFSGFCATGTIPESDGSSAIGGCSTIDRTLANYFTCPSNTAITSCKNKWCVAHAVTLNWNGFVGTVPQIRNACFSYIRNGNNWAHAICAQVPAIKDQINSDPFLCLTNQDCKQCVDDLTDFPSEIATILGGVVAVTPAPTSKCGGDLLTAGLTRKYLRNFQSGIEIDFFDTATNKYVGVFALTNLELTACNGCNNPIFVNGSASNNAALLQPGKYRIKQCVGLDTDPKQDLCSASPGYNVSVDYSFPIDGVLASTPYAKLWDSGDITCNPMIYDKCPPDYRCCVWDKSNPSDAIGWELCMDNNYENWRVLYPNC